MNNYERGVWHGVLSGGSFMAVVLLRGVPAIIALLINLASYRLLRPKVPSAASLLQEETP